MTRLARLLAVAIALAGCTACVTYDRGEFAAVSTTAIVLEPAPIGQTVEGRACDRLFEEPLARAVDDALSKSRGSQALRDVRFGFENLCVVVRGTAIRLP
jgi:hypothetical protein